MRIVGANRRGQVTIFIIVAIVLVAIVALFFVLRSMAVPKIVHLAEENPEAFMQLCIEDDLNAITHLLTLQGGFYDPKDYVLVGNDNKATYLCKNVGSFKPCINQHPMYFTEVANEVKREISPVIEQCFNDMETGFEEKGMDVVLGDNTIIDVNLAPENVFVNVKRDFSLIQKGEMKNYQEVNLGLRSSLYDLSHVAARIANNEAEFCYFSAIGYMALHPEYLISMRKYSDGTKAYTLTDSQTGDEMNFATRGCVLT